MIASAVGKVLTAVTEDAGRIDLHFADGSVYQIVPAGFNLHVWRTGQCEWRDGYGGPSGVRCVLEHGHAGGHSVFKTPEEREAFFENYRKKP